MNHGSEFLKGQVNNAVIQHGAFLSALEEHVESVDGAAGQSAFTQLDTII